MSLSRLASSSAVVNYRAPCVVAHPRACHWHRYACQGVDQLFVSELMRPFSGRLCVADSTGAKHGRYAVARASVQDAALEATRLTLDVEEVRNTVRLGSATLGPGLRAIVIEALADGCSAWLAGARPGDRVLGISDPQRPATVWPVDGSSRLRFVRDIVQMCRGPTIVLDVEMATFATPAIQISDDPGVEDERATAASTPQLQGTSYSTAGALGIPPPTPAASNSVLESELGTMWEDTGEYARPHPEGRLERLERAYKQQQARQRREDRRRGVLEDAGRRQDGRTYSLVALACALPSITILAYAYFSGYMDHLQRISHF